MAKSKNSAIMVIAVVIAGLILGPPTLYLCLIAAVIKALHKSD